MIMLISMIGFIDHVVGVGVGIVNDDVNARFH